MNHELKTVSPYFERIQSGEKTVEVRKDDRDFQTGDTLTLKHWDPDYDHGQYSRTPPGRFTGSTVKVQVTHALRGFEGLAEGWVALSISPTTVTSTAVEPAGGAS